MKSLSKETYVSIGEVVTFKNVFGEEITEEVKPACKNKTNGVWLCVNHKRSFRSNLEWVHHIEKGNHHIAWICMEHGVEIP